MMIAISESGLIDAFTTITNQLAKFFSWINKLNPAILKWASIIAIAVAALGPILWIFGSISSAIAIITTAISALLPVLALLKASFIALAGALLLNPITWIITAIVAAIAGAAYLFYKHWTPVIDFFKNMWHKISNFFKSAHDTIKGWINKIISFIQPALDLIDTIYNLSLDDITNGITSAVSNMSHSVMNSIKSAGNAISNAAQNAWNYLFGNDEDLTQHYKPIFQKMQSIIQQQNMTTPHTPQMTPIPNLSLANTMSYPPTQLSQLPVAQSTTPTPKLQGGIDVTINLKNAPQGTTLQSQSTGTVINNLNNGIGFAEAF